MMKILAKLLRKATRPSINDEELRRWAKIEFPSDPDFAYNEIKNGRTPDFGAR